ncbi:MAG: hypothetical protein ACR2IS_00345 [Nitrososphaeraceae archaeon]
MEISDKLVYVIGPVIAAIAFYIRYRWRKQDQRRAEQDKIQKEKEKKENESPFGRTVAGTF